MEKNKSGKRGRGRRFHLNAVVWGDLSGKTVSEQSLEGGEGKAHGGICAKALCARCR